MARGRQATAQSATLSQSLVLNRFILDLFGAKSFEAFGEDLKDVALEGYDENNVSFFHHQLVTKLYHNEYFTKELLLEYDERIFRYSEEISTSRGEEIRWKYFQYMSLLFTEIYLDKYFSDKGKLLADLNDFLENKFNVDPSTYHDIPSFTEDDLNKLAFWNATGSGKTLLMHVNIKQIQYYAEKHGCSFNKIILLTPNEGLTNQHLSEFEQSGIGAAVFSKSGSMFSGKEVEIIEITKLADKNGEKTVAVDSFEGNNLVFVDEGHKGASGDVWKKMREKLSVDGFSFEYSATFGQAISAATGSKRISLLDEYAKATLFDYSYKYFYKDGYGKDYQILNLNDGWDDGRVTMYLTACLLGFYEQIRMFSTDTNKIKPFLLDKPLAIFVGSSVTAVRKEGKVEVSDVVEILKFFERFVNKSEESLTNIHRLLNGTDGLVDKNNHSIFGYSFKYLRKIYGDNENDVYAGMLSEIFNSNIAGAKLHLDNLRGQDGEIGLRVGNADYFGVISVGDDAALLKLCAANGMSTFDNDFAQKSLFTDIDRRGSKINILIGSKKFNTGWNSWRVSTMCLLNIGKGEGSEIIQLFGRGVRLKGYLKSLKRSSALDLSIAPSSIPESLYILETLSIFGIRADYMEQFKQYLEEEGLPTNDSDYEEISIPTMLTVDLAGKKLKYLTVEEGRDFKQDVIVNMRADREGVVVALDYYPKVQILKSKKTAVDSINGELNEAKLTKYHLAFVDWDKVFFELVKFKNEKSWYNLNISKQALKDIANKDDWYKLFIPNEELAFDDFGLRTNLWQDILITLLKMYAERTYNIEKSKWMSEHVVTAFLDSSNPNFEKEYKVLVNRELDTVIDRLKRLKVQIERHEFSMNYILDTNKFESIYFSQHLYQPLIHIKQDAYDTDEGRLIEVKPVALNVGEMAFVEDLKKFYEGNKTLFDGKELYLLRNQSKKGIGFFDTSGFYPDFIMWIISGGKQYVSFIDPKGLRNLGGMSSSKIQLHKEIRKTIEPRLNDDSVILNSFIVSVTPFRQIGFWKDGDTIDDFNKNHVYFQNEQRGKYISLMMNSILSSEPILE